MSVEGRDGADGEEELATWRARARPRKRPTQNDRAQREAEHVQFRTWCARCMMGRGRMHLHVTKQRCEDEPRKAHHCSGLLLQVNAARREVVSNIRRSKNLHCDERRQTLEHHDQRCAEEWNRRTMDKGESGKSHRLAWIP